MARLTVLIPVCVGGRLGLHRRVVTLGLPGAALLGFGVLGSQRLHYIGKTG